MIATKTSYTAFQRHLLHFAVPERPIITFTSGLKASLSLGLNFPLSVFLSLALRVLYSPFPWLSPIDIESIPLRKHRTQLEFAQLYQQEYTASDLLRLYVVQKNDDRNDKHGSTLRRIVNFILDQGHILSFWALTANTSTNRVSREYVHRFQHGEWEKYVVERRRGPNDILPFWRGGPLSARGHSWAVKKFIGVQVYDVQANRAR